jgi:hypothetical protein
VELQGVVRAQTHVQSDFEKVRQRVPLVCEEQRIIAQWRHGQSYLLEVKQVLESGHLAEQNPVGYGMRSQESRRKMIRISRFTAMRSEYEGI